MEHKYMHVQVSREDDRLGPDLVIKDRGEILIQIQT